MKCKIFFHIIKQNVPKHILDLFRYEYHTTDPIMLHIWKKKNYSNFHGNSSKNPTMICKNVFGDTGIQKSTRINYINVVLKNHVNSLGNFIISTLYKLESSKEVCLARMGIWSNDRWKFCFFVVVLVDILV